MGHPQAGIFPLFNGDGVVKPLPQKAVIGFRFVWWSHLEILDRANNGFSMAVKKSFFMSTVIDEEGIFPVASAKMGPQQRQNTIFRLDFTTQDPTKFREADKALEKMGFTVQMPNRRGNGIEGFIGKIS